MRCDPIALDRKECQFVARSAKHAHHLVALRDALEGRPGLLVQLKSTQPEVIRAI